MTCKYYLIIFLDVCNICSYIDIITSGYAISMEEIIAYRDIPKG